MDPYFRVEVLNRTEHPQTLCWWAMHQDYSEEFAFDENPPSEPEAGALVVKHLLAGERGHYGPLEHPSITFACGWFPHSVMQQARTHRVGVSFDVQCLAGDAEITLVSRSGLKARTVSIEELALMWEKDPARVRTLRLRSLDEAENRFVSNRIAQVFKSGQKPVFNIELADGKTLRCTGEHRILTPNGWRTAAQLGPGDAVMVNGRATADAPNTYQNKDWLIAHFAEGKIPKEVALLAGVSTEAIKKWAYFHGLTWQKRPPYSHEGKRLNISEEERERRRIHAAQLNRGRPNRGPQHPSWRADLPIEKRAYNWLKYERLRLLERVHHTCQDCGTQHTRLHCHHIKPVLERPDLAMDESNIVVLCPSCHKHRHNLAAHAVLIRSVTPAGVMHTYDIAMEAPYHNFVANGVVVHNSGRYTGQRICAAATGAREIEEVFYLRPVGKYRDRQGHAYEYTEDLRFVDYTQCLDAAVRYKAAIDRGFAEEHARDMIPYAIRQHFVVSFSLRALMHFMDLRAKRDAQLEIQQLCDLMWPHFEAWAPAIAGWYGASRLHKARLAP